MADVHPPELSEAEIEDWAAVERRRREAWLSGLTPEQQQAWAAAERRRRDVPPSEAMGLAVLEPARAAQRYMRQAQLITEGAVCLMWKWSRQGLETLIENGREWEEEFAPRITRGSQSGRDQPDPRRITLEDDAPPS